MMYTEKDVQGTRAQLIRRVAVAAIAALILNGIAAVIMYTVRIEWLSMALALLGGAAAIFCWGMFGRPVYAYLRYLREVVSGRTHDFTGVLTEIAQDSVREGVPCKTLFFSDDAGDAQRLCYYDLYKYPTEGCQVNQRYTVTVHGQAIVSIQPE